MSKQAGGNFEFLDSQELSDAANELDACISKYNDIVRQAVRSTDVLLALWSGEGRTAFEKDYNTIYRQLSDISDIMYDLYDSLVDADATYVQTDEDIAKGLTMETV